MKPCTLTMAILAILMHSGCELITEDQNPPVLRPAGTLVINEVFSLPASHPTTFTWIEFYNPTKDTVDLTGWTLSYTTRRTDLVVPLDTSGNQLILRARRLPAVEGIFDVPLPPLRIPADQFFTLVGNEARLLDHTRYGPGNGIKLQAPGRISIPLPTIEAPPDSIAADTLLLSFYDFDFRETDQIVLKNAEIPPRPVDVIRYGNYTYTGPGSDPFPNNRSLGVIPLFESMARYAGAYHTGNTSEDFYITGPGLRPIPHWYSQLVKQ